MKLGVDIDGVICDTRESIVEIFNLRFDKKLRAKELEHYDLKKLYGDQANNYFREVEYKIYRESKPIKGAAEYLNKLSIDNKIFFITARSDTFSRVTQDWLEQHGFHHNYILDHSEDKKKACFNFDIDAFIEDSTYNARKIAELGIPVLLFDQPYNRNFCNYKAKRVYEWPEIYDILRRISDG